MKRVLVLAALWSGCWSNEPSMAIPRDNGATTSMHGTWSMQMTAEQAMELAAMELALREPPPTQEEIEAASLTEKQMAVVAMILMTRESDPTAPTVNQMREAIDDMKGATVTIAPETITFAVGEERQVSAYRVVGEEPAGVHVLITDEEGTESRASLSLLTPDSLRIVQDQDPENPLVFIRR